MYYRLQDGRKLSYEEYLSQSEREMYTDAPLETRMVRNQKNGKSPIEESGDKHTTTFNYFYYALFCLLIIYFVYMTRPM